MLDDDVELYLRDFQGLGYARLSKESNETKSLPQTPIF